MRKPGWLVMGAVALFGLTLMANEKPSEAYSKAMKDINAGVMGLRAAVTAKDYDGIAKQATTVKTSFDVVEQFWTAKKTDDAIAAAKAGAKAATDLAAAATAKNDEGIAAAQRALGGTCMGCHTAHRERLADGTFEIK
jgi:mono/diheme cytochrome c family protein